MLPIFQETQRRCAVISRLVEQLPPNRLDRPGFIQSALNSNYQLLAKNEGPSGRNPSPASQKNRGIYRGDFAIINLEEGNVALVEILLIRGNSVTTKKKTVRKGKSQLYSAATPFPDTLLFKFRHFYQTALSRGRRFESEQNQLWSYDFANCVRTIIPRCVVDVSERRGGSDVILPNTINVTEMKWG
jgi:hypothetical protein